MDPLAAHILTICNQAPTEAQLTAPRRYRRRKTWVPVPGDRVTVWRMTSHDPDIDEALSGVFISETDTYFVVLLDRDEHGCRLKKKDRHGVSLWRMDSRGPNTQKPTESGVTS